MTVSSIRFIDNKNGRSIKVKLVRGPTITIEPCHESWEQYGGGRHEELQETMRIAERYNDWLHGGPMPDV